MGNLPRRPNNSAICTASHGDHVCRSAPAERPDRQVAEIFVGVPTKQSQLNDYGPSGNVLTVRALREFGIDRNDLVHVHILNPRELARYQAKSDDLVLSARSTSLKMGIVPPRTGRRGRECDLDGY